MFDQFKEKLLELTHIKYTLGLLSWDQEVYMPPKGAEVRANTIAYLTGLLHEKFFSAEFETLLKEVIKLKDENKLDEKQSAIVREVSREFEIEKKLPLEFVKELARLGSEAQNVWIDARKKSDFAKFAPYLKKMVALKRKEAEYKGYKDSPYDALLDNFEPWLTSAEATIILNELKDFLVVFIEKIKKSKVKIDPQLLHGNFSAQQQAKFNSLVAKAIGFDLEAGRIDISAHPFETGHHPHDIRITTRFNEEDLLNSLMGVVHESGHAIYEQGILAENFGTPLGEPISLGIHESQSRMWENIVARSLHFWQYFYPLLQKEFTEPFAKIALEDFYKALNRVEPSLIRVEADEVTYNLHIIIRFEIEKELIEGSIEVDDLPKIWNDKYKQYLDVDVPNDAMGVMQDVHWSAGMIGYFPTYTLGNLYSAQFYSAAKKDIMNLEGQFEKGQFEIFRNWLQKNIHIHGKFYSASDLVKNVTGEQLTSKYFIDYLKNKYTEIYNLK